jgi:hypothetical protein
MISVVLRVVRFVRVVTMHPIGSGRRQGELAASTYAGPIYKPFDNRQPCGSQKPSGGNYG